MKRTVDHRVKKRQVVVLLPQISGAADLTGCQAFRFQDCIGAILQPTGLMSRFRKSIVMPLAAMLGMVVQLGVVAFHHHETLGTHGAGHGHEVHTALELADHATHDHHDHDVPGDTHHSPDDSDDHDCETCVLKSAVSSQLVPVSVATLLAPVQTGKRQLAVSKEVPRLKIVLRYHARAPPSQAAFS